MKKRLFILFSLFCLFNLTLNAQVSVTATGATTGPTSYINFSTAFTAINNGTHTGAITVSVSGNFSETGTPTINSSGTGAASYTSILIKPVVGVNPVITNTADNTAGIKLDGADNVTIDGSNTAGGTTRNMTFVNTNTSGSGRATNIWLASKNVDGATNNVVKNCKLAGSGAPGGAPYMGACVYSGNSVLAGYWETTAPTISANSNNTIQNNLMNGANIAVALIGGAGTGETGNQITGNTIGDNTSAANLKFTNAGIFLSNQANFKIEQNSFTWIASTNTNVASGGISVGTGCIAGSIARNTMTNIRFNQTNVLTAGILLRSSSGSNIKVVNNFISDIASAGATTPANNTYGMAVAVGTGYEIAFNSISMGTNPTTTANGYQAALYIDASVNTLQIRNNLFVRSGTNTTNKYSVYSISANPSGSTIDYNDYYNSGTTLAYAGAAQANLTNVQTNLQNNLNHSKNVLPVFLSASDLHLLATNTSNQTNLQSAGVSITGISVDYDGTFRPAIPTIGAHELTLSPSCNTIITWPAATNAMAAPVTICAFNGTTSLSVITGIPVVTGLTYQWEWSSNGITGWIDASPLLTSPAYTVTGVTTSRYFRCKVMCSGNVVWTSGNTPMVTAVSPTLTVTDGSHCGPGSITLSATITGNDTAKWYSTSSGGTPIAYGTSFVTPLLNSTTSYYVAAASVAVSGCESSRQEIVGHIYPVPVVDLGPDINKCIDAGAMELLDPGIQPDTSSYLWDNGDTLQTRFVNHSGIYSILVTNQYDCAAKDTIIVTLRNNPEVHLGNDTTICHYAELLLDAGNTGADYVWNTGETTQMITVYMPGSYRVLVTNNQGCFKLDTITMYMNGELPTIQDIIIDNDGQYTFNFRVIDPQNVVSYDWDFGDNSPHSTLAAPTHTYTDNANYIVILRLGSSCGFTLDSAGTHIVGIHDLNVDQKELTVYPNPAVEKTTVLNRGTFKMKQIVMYDVSGRLLYSSGAENSRSYTLMLKDFASGIYTIVITTDKGTIKRKLEIKR